MRFVHIADVHLDTPFASRSPAVRDRLRDATREAFRAAVDLALQQGVHAFLIAGDLFDGDRVSFQTESFVLAELGRLTEAGIRVVYATGNHDPGAAGYRALEISWPDGVDVVAGAEPHRVEIRDPEGRVVGVVTAAGHETSRESRDLSSEFPRPEGDLPQVAMLHTQVVGSVEADAHHAYAPSALEALIRSGYHYWALGHVHHRQVLSESPAIHYPGNPQGRTPREDGPRGGLVVDLSEPLRPRTAFHALGPVRWARLRVAALEDCRNLEQLVDRVAAAWAETPGARGAATSDTLLQLSLAGPSPLWHMLGAREELDALAGSVASRLDLLWVDVLPPRVHPVVSVEEHLERADVLGEALRLVGRHARGDEALDEIPDHELALLSVEDVGDRTAYLTSLLEGAQEDVLARMHRNPGGGSGGR